MAQAQGVVDALEALLERARSGEIQGIAYTCATRWHSGQTGFAGDFGHHIVVLVDLDNGDRKPVEMDT